MRISDERLAQALSWWAAPGRGNGDFGYEVTADLIDARAALVEAREALQEARQELYATANYLHRRDGYTKTESDLRRVETRVCGALARIEAVLGEGEK